MHTLSEIFKKLYGYEPFPSSEPKNKKRVNGKHQASKRGHKHNHSLSLGERRHQEFVATVKKA